MPLCRRGNSTAWVSPIVVQHRYAPKINLVTDASLTGGSGFISQGEELPKSKVVAFWSGKFNPAQQNYPVHELELLAIVESLKRFRGMLHGTKFRICTDHKALQYFMTQKNLSSRQSRWLDVLNEFDFEIFYIPGKTNVLADALSRLYSEDAPGTVRAESEHIVEASDEDDSAMRVSIADLSVPNACRYSAPVLTGAEAMCAAAGFGPDSGSQNGFQDGTPSRPRRRAAQVAERAWAWLKPRSKLPASQHEAGQLSARENEGAQKEQDTPGTDVPAISAEEPEGADQDPKTDTLQHVLEPEMDEPEEEPLEYGDAALGSVVNDTEPEIHIPGSFARYYAQDKFFKGIIAKPNDFTNFRLDGDLLYIMTGEERLICVPDFTHNGRSVKEIIIEQAHSVIAHLGASKTLQYIRTYFWWKGMAADIDHYCKTCSTCAFSKSSTQAPMGKLKTLPIPSRPWESIGVDFVGPLPASFNRVGRFNMLCVIIDHLTSMVHLVPTHDTDTAEKIAEALYEHV